jgi:hypothetical protein
MQNIDCFDDFAPHDGSQYQVALPPSAVPHIHGSGPLGQITMDDLLDSVPMSDYKKVFMFNCLSQFVWTEPLPIEFSSGFDFAGFGSDYQLWSSAVMLVTDAVDLAFSVHYGLD